MNNFSEFNEVYGSGSGNIIFKNMKNCQISFDVKNRNNRQILLENEILKESAVKYYDYEWPIPCQGSGIDIKISSIDKNFSWKTKWNGSGSNSANIYLDNLHSVQSMNESECLSII